MPAPDSTRLYALCAYGLSPSLSIELLSIYDNEDEIPLNEFDASEYRSVESL